ncbi:hypothetical protein MJ1_0243 [Nanobdella aerobiophila]|uniref:Uncharacterized protein n=1 Tax=Nanobdella aerobiophila TaxID=2586965 RepID=A0A915WRM8_9ARCH|nr:hypothetical protein [Nanobdella aerobiophila]BBL45414.1 hypothetical protein MJ1_0243 [Nanobdella aerobiophila]
MKNRSQGLPLNVIVLAIIAILVLVFLILIFTGGLGRFTTGISSTGPTTQQINSTQCAEYAGTVLSEIESSTDPNTQIDLFSSSSYCSYSCYNTYPQSFTLSNGSTIVCNSGGCQLDGQGSNLCSATG